MIIGIDATRANKPQKTGVEWYSYHLIRALTALPSPYTFRLYFKDEPEAGLRNLGPHVQNKILSWTPKYLWTQMRLASEMFLSPPDLLFVPAHAVPIIHPWRTVTTIHDVAFRAYPKSYTWKSRWYHEWAVRKSRWLPAIITVSNFSKSEIIRYYPIPADSINVTYLGFQHEVFDSSPMVLTKYAIRQPYIISVGRLERKKNVSLLIESFALIKKEPWGRNMQLVLVGIKGHGWHDIERLIKESPYKKDIIIVGWVTEPEKHALIEGALLLVMVSAYEGFGLPLLEAMDRGTPVVSSNQAALPEIAGDAALLVKRGDAPAIRDAVNDIIHDAKLREGLIARGKKRVKNFTWEKTARETLTVFEDLLKSEG